MLVPITDYEFAQHYGTENALTYIWDVPTLTWVKSTGGGGGGGGGAVTVADGADVTQGAVADAAWVAGNGTVISLLKKIASAGGSAVSISDGSDVVEGALADAAVVTDSAGTISGKLRGLVKWAFERMPAALGQGTMAQSLRVVLASDQSAVAVSGPLTDVQLRATPVPVSGTVAVTSAGLTNLDVALSTRLKPADTLAAVTTVGTITNPVAVTSAGLTNLDVALSTRLKPADTLAAVTAITNVVHVDDNAGSLTVDGTVAVSNFPATQPVSGTVTANQGGAPWSENLTQVAGAAISLGQKVMASSLPVTLASDQTALTVTTGGLTDSQLRASAVPVSGTVTATGAALEAGGNLAAIVTSNQNMALLLQLTQQQQGLLRAIYFQLALISGSSMSAGIDEFMNETTN